MMNSTDSLTVLLAERERRKRRRARGGQPIPDADLPWPEWLVKKFPTQFAHAFAAHHREFWDWVWSIELGVRPPPFVAIWPRGGAKSSSAELACSALGLRRRRRYAVYVSDTQDQADKHVATIGSGLEHAGVVRAVNKYGNSRGWRRNRLKTADGFTVDSLGLDTASRGVKDEESRPDLIILDDIDGRHDTPAATQKKMDTITETILPAGTGDCAVIAAQNLIHANGIFARLADGRAGFLSDRILSGPIPALRNFTYEQRGIEIVIATGEPAWAGQGVAVCQENIKTWGLRAFKREAQHDVLDAEGALWNSILLEAQRVTSVPVLTRTVVFVDPSGTSGGDEAGIIAGGIGPCDCKGFVEPHAFILADDSLQGSPDAWAKAAVSTYNRQHADRMLAESNYGGEMVSLTIGTVKGAPPVTLIMSSKGKQARAEPVVALYEQGKVHHMGYFAQLEEEQTTWEPDTGAPSPNRLDALVGVVTELMLSGVDPDAWIASMKRQVLKKRKTLVDQQR